MEITLIRITLIIFFLKVIESLYYLSQGNYRTFNGLKIYKVLKWLQFSYAKAYAFLVISTAIVKK